MALKKQTEKKLAVFVEGQTEQLFINKLISEIAGLNNVDIIEEKAALDKKTNKRTFSSITAYSKTSGKKYFVLIRDCNGESNVKSDILSSYPKLVQQNFHKILGLRDAYPTIKFKDKEKFKKSINLGLPSTPATTLIILAVMEIEAWFIAETGHFSKIDPLLNNKLVSAKLRFDPETINIETRAHPSDDLKRIYQLKRKSYNKSRANVLRTINALDFYNIYIDLPNRIDSLKELITELNSFFT